MCVKFTSAIKVMKKDRVVWKAVCINGRESAYIPGGRQIQSRFPSGGIIISYEKGKTVFSDMNATPGIYACRQKGEYLKSIMVGRRWVSLLCKKGTRYKLSNWRGSIPAINVEQAEVLD